MHNVAGLGQGLGIEKKEKMNIEHSTLNIERRMKKKAGFKFLI